MDNSEYIEDYFGRTQTVVEKQAFESRILNDTGFAEEVAFYIKATSVLKEKYVAERKDQFRELYQQQQQEKKVVQMPIRRLWKYLSAACVALVAFASTWLMSGGVSQVKLADKYIGENMQTLSVSMGAGNDSLQKALDLYNHNEMAAALKLLELSLTRDSADATLLDYAGITALRLADYEKADRYFGTLAADTTLKANPGKLYQALMHMKRNAAGDKDIAKQLLKQIVDGKLDGEKQAEEWLKKMK